METSALIGELVPFLQRRGYEPGERIPTERELAVRFGVSRGQVREALSSLEALRIVERRAKSGMFMAAGEPSIEALALFARIGVPIDPEDVRQTVEMRRIHEVEAIKLACARRSPANIERMREILDAAEAAIGDAAAVAEHDRLFHAEVVRATQNEVFLRIVDIFYLMTAQRRTAYFADPARQRRSAQEHRRMLDAIVASDAPLAVELIHAHLQGVDSYWRGLIDTPAEAPDSRRADR